MESRANELSQSISASQQTLGQSIGIVGQTARAASIEALMARILVCSAMDTILPIDCWIPLIAFSKREKV